MNAMKTIWEDRRAMKMLGLAIAAGFLVLFYYLIYLIMF